MKNILPILFLLFILPLSIDAQEPVLKQKKFAIGILPQYAFNNGLRMDFDFRVGKTKTHWLITSPQIYLASNDPVLYSYESMWGVGMDLEYRYYFKANNELPRGYHMGFGPMFQFFSIDDERLFANKVIENGIEYTVVEYGPVNTSIYKYGMTAQAGYQAIISRAIYVDFFVGAGIRLSFDDTGRSGLSRNYNNWWGSYGYSGTMLTGGIRFGMIK
ncbi:MAG: DUF3575 domain-containing protein [Bacteroidales bacterium]|nr:DUF3575 domain-containing protein [Bacteroidales bacterium]